MKTKKLLVIALFCCMVWCLTLVACSHDHTTNPDLYSNATEHWNVCSVCHEPVNKEPHTWDNGIVTLPATVTTTGIKTYTCTVCGKTKQQEIPTVDHTCRYDIEWIADTTSHWQECTVCGKEQNKEAHVWDSGIITQEATTTSKGTKTYTCTVCEKKKYEDIPIIPHTHNYYSDWSSDDTYHWHACYSCDEMNSKEKHSWDEGVVTLPATKTAEGVKTYTCSVCKKIKMEAIAILPSNNEPVFSLNEKNTEYVVIGFDGNATEIVIPDTYNGLRVTAIAESAFAENVYIKKITLPNTITVIGQGAFQGCANLAQINIPESVLSIDADAFEGCSALNKVTFASAIDESSTALNIGNAAFKNCVNLTSIQLAQYTESIGDSAFENCYSLKSITMNDNLKYLGSYAFAKCIVLGGVTLNEGLVSIGSYAFDECESITEIIFPNTVKTVGAGAFRNAKSLQSVTLSSKITAIADNTFQNCTALKAVELHENILNIGSSAFSCCTSLETVKILGNVNNWGNNAFYRCEKLKELYINSSVIQSLNNENYIFYNAGINSESLTLTVGQNGYIPHGLFEPIHAVNAPKITSIVIEDGATDIDYFTKYNKLPYVTSITIPNSITFVNALAFDSCPNLVYNQYDNACYLGNENNPYLYLVKAKSTDLTSCEVNENCQLICEGAFSGCSSLESITIPFVGAKAGVTSSDTHQYPFGYIFGTDSYDGSVKTYQCYYGSSTTGKTYDYYYIPSSLKSVTVTGGNILYGAFYNCSNITSITIGNDVTSIGSYAFYKCSSLTIYCEVESEQSGWNSYWNYSNCPVVWDCNNNEVAYDGNVYTVIDGIRYALKDGVATVVRQPSNVVSVTIPSLVTHKETSYPVTSIGSSAFAGCSSLTSITIPSSVTSIGAGAFNGCSSLEEITIPFVGAKAGVTSSNTYQYPFGYIFGTSSYTDGVKTYQYYYGSSTSSTTYDYYYIPSSLKSVTVTGGNILYGAFNNCSNITSITIGDDVTSIGDEAFYNCSKLATVTFGENSQLTSIGNYAFSGCNKLTSIEIPASVTSIGDYAFGTCSSLTKIHFNGTIAQWNAIIKSNSWNSGTGSYTIICTDGTISK